LDDTHLPLDHQQRQSTDKQPLVVVVVVVVVVAVAVAVAVAAVVTKVVVVVVVVVVQQFVSSLCDRDVARHGFGDLMPPKFLAIAQIEFSPLCNIGYIKSN